MKATVILLTVSLLMINSARVTAQQDSTDYQSELERYEEMKHIGKVLTLTGFGVATLGALVYIGSKPQPNSFNLFNDELRTGGLILCGVGAVLLVPGLVLFGNGNVKSKEIQSKPNSLKIEPYYTPKQAGITLSYRF